MKDGSLIPNNLLPGSPILKTFTMNQQIYWFEDSLRRWIFKPAKLLLDTGISDVDFAVLGILNAVPELLAKCQGYEKTYINETFVGKNPGISEYLYRKGIEYIFPDRDDNVFEDEELIVDLIYGTLRCGLAHFAFASERIFLSRADKNLSSIGIDYVDVGTMPGWTYFPPSLLILINVPEWYKQTEMRIGNYISDLRDPTNDDLRSKFSERITRGDTPRKGEPTGCMCHGNQFCVTCALEKFPNSHIDATICNDE